MKLIDFKTKLFSTPHTAPPPTIYVFETEESAEAWIDCKYNGSENAAYTLAMVIQSDLKLSYYAKEEWCNAEVEAFYAVEPDVMVVVVESPYRATSSCDADCYENDKVHGIAPKMDKVKTQSKCKSCILGYMHQKYENREDKDNIFGVGISDAEFRQFVIDYLLGEDWYVVDPLGQSQISEVAIYEILEKYSPRFRKERKLCKHHGNGKCDGKVESS